jgi:plasmid stabilization system protein ParE
MAQQIIYKKRFINKLNKLLLYLEREWSAAVANEFLDKLEDHLKKIKFYPTIGNLTSLKNTRSVLITKHNKIYYRVEKNKIVLINMIDTRRNPKKNPFNKNI